MQITFGGNGQIESAMASELLEHVVVKRDPGGDGCNASAIKIDGDIDGCLFGAALDVCCTCHLSILAVQTARLTVNC